jgi:hypothetical protein
LWHINAGLMVILTGEWEHGHITRVIEGAVSCNP